MSEEKRILSKIFAMIHLFMEKSKRNNSPVVQYLLPEALKNKINLSIPDNGISYDELLKDIELYLEYCVDTSSAQFFNQLYAGLNFPAFLGEIITALTNTSMYTYEVAPVASLIELELIKKMNQLIGFSNGEGTFLTGGSNANLVAMISARNKTFPEINQKGANNMGNMSLFVSEHSHYSFNNGANILGIGTDLVKKIKTDDNGCMVPEILEKAIQESINQNETPFFIAATAGTTLLGGFDPIDAISQIARKYNIWLHVDGAFGGSVILSNTYKYLLEGIDQADSFTWDAHKLMNIPLICSVLLIKEKGRLTKNLTGIDAEYLFHENDTKCFDLGKSSVQCGKRVDVLKLWLSWKFFGDKGYEARIDKLFNIAEYATKKIKSNNQLELLLPPQSLAVCFRYRNSSSTNINDFNLALRERLIKSGKSLINYGYWKDNVALRFVAANPGIKEKDIDQFFDNLMGYAKQIEEKEKIS
ncbi:MAG: aminotransferase class V-fold PLP-dependent enzyme [Desulfobacterales bacterium]